MSPTLRKLNTGRWIQVGASLFSAVSGTKTRYNIPPLGGGVLLSFFSNKLSLPRLRALDKRAILLVEFTQDTRNLALVYNALTLSPSTGITRPVLPGACIR